MSDEEDKTLAVTFSTEAWEYLYLLLEDYTNRRMAVTLNDSDQPVQLLHIEGDIWKASDAVLVVYDIGYSEDNTLASPDNPRRISLFTETECAITKVHVL